MQYIVARVIANVIYLEHLNYNILRQDISFMRTALLKTNMR